MSVIRHARRDIYAGQRHHANGAWSLKLSVTGSATNTYRSLTPSLEVTKEGLAVHASRPRNAVSSGPASTLSHRQPKIVHGFASRPNHSQGRSGPCSPFDGPETKWRERVVTRCWVELAIDHGSLAWPTPMCGTPLCMNHKHLAWEAPTKLAYPDGVRVYCGMIAGTKDHLLPRTWTGESVRRNVLTVPACGECNSTISDRYAPSVTERRKVAHAGILKRKKRVINMPVWTKAEIAELGPTLRSSINLGLHEQKLTLARLAWPEDPDYDLRVMQLSGIENPYEIGILS